MVVVSGAAAAAATDISDIFTMLRRVSLLLPTTVQCYHYHYHYHYHIYGKAEPAMHIVLQEYNALSNVYDVYNTREITDRLFETGDCHS